MMQAILFLAAALIFVPLAVRLGLGSVLGYLVAGVAIGPVGLGLVNDPQALLHVSELGVVLMLRPSLDQNQAFAGMIGLRSGLSVRYLALVTH